MIKRDELIKFIYEYFGKELMQKAARKDEIAANGAQILGGKNVEKITLGVSCNLDFLKEAVSIGSNFCIFHHGFDPRTYKMRFPLHTQKRLRLIFQKQMTIMGFHYILDSHPKIGNNATIINKLGARIKNTLFDEWGYTAEFDVQQDIKKLA